MNFLRFSFGHVTWKKKNLPRRVSVWVGVGFAVCLLSLTMSGCRNEPPPPPEEPSVQESLPEPEESSNPEPEPEESSQPDVEPYPKDKLVYTQDRLDYQDGDMMLSIPRLKLDTPVLTGVVDPADSSTAGVVDTILHQGVGMFGCAQLPGPGNPNTSLAGHRDIYNEEFYYLDTITEGDLIYLEYKGNRYTYEYEETQIVDDSEWSVVFCKDYACVTLLTCHPINVASHRMIVVGRLIEVMPIEEISKS